MLLHDQYKLTNFFYISLTFHFIFLIKKRFMRSGYISVWTVAGPFTYGKLYKHLDACRSKERQTIRKVPIDSRTLCWWFFEKTGWEVKEGFLILYLNSRHIRTKERFHTPLLKSPIKRTLNPKIYNTGFPCFLKIKHSDTCDIY